MFGNRTAEAELRAGADMVPGDNINMLFTLAGLDVEYERLPLTWYA